MHSAPRAFYLISKLFGLLAVCMAGALRLPAQPLVSPPSQPNIEIVQVGALPAGQHAWASILADSTLPFRPTDSLRLAQGRQFWLRLRVRNRSQYTAAVRLMIQPSFDNTLFYVDEDARDWRTQRAGLLVPTDTRRMKGQLPLRLQAGTTTCYVLVRLPAQASLPHAARLQLKLQPEEVAQRENRFFVVAWAVSMAVLLLLLLTNVPTYVRFRDRTTLFYICTQVGAVLYVTACRNYFRMLFPSPVFSRLLLPSGLSYSYTINNIVMHLSVALMLLGFVQMTRAYLSTPARLPRLDVVLRAALGGYCGFTVVVALVNLSGFLLNYYTLRFDNLLVLCVIGLLLATTVVAYRRRLPLARTYLLANVLPLLAVMGVAAYHVVMGFGDESAQMLPDLAIVSHALFFSAAISVRLQATQQTLLAKEREAGALALDIQQQELRHREIVLKNSHIQTALLAMQRRQLAHHEQAQQLSHDHQQQQAHNQDLLLQLEANQRELASTSLYVQQKNALLAELKQQIQELSTQRPGQQPELAGIKSILQSSLYLDEDWSKFKLHFEQVHPRFFEELQARYPALTKNEQRLYCYFHINLATKEIAALLNIDPASVRRAKTRLYKKIAAADEQAGRTPPGNLAQELLPLE